MTSFESCYTPTPKAVEVEHVFAVKEWMSPFSTVLHNISNPHAFKFTKAPSGKVVMQYKNWGSDKKENWKPVDPDPEQWLTIERARVSYIHNTFIMSANVFTISEESKFLQRSEKISYNTEKTTLRRLQNEIKKKR